MRIFNYLLPALGLIQCLAATQPEESTFNTLASDDNLKVESRQLDDDLHLSAIPITNDNVGYWQNFAATAVDTIKSQNPSEQSIRQIKDAASTFSSHLAPNHTWVVVASTKPYTQAIAPESIEMVMTATTDSGSSFIKHMGIFRNPQFQGNNHRGISLKMHWLSATVIPTLKPQVKFVLSHPLPVMTGIIKKAFPDSHISLRISDKDNWDKILPSGFPEDAKVELCSAPKWLMQSSYGENDTIIIPVDAIRALKN